MGMNKYETPGWNRHAEEHQKAANSALSSLSAAVRQLKITRDAEVQIPMGEFQVTHIGAAVVLPKITREEINAILASGDSRQTVRDKIRALYEPDPQTGQRRHFADDAIHHAADALRNIEREIEHGWDPQGERTPYRVMIHVEQLVSDEELDEEDAEDNPAGDHEYTVMARNEDEASELALDQFHGEIPIAVLDDFDIETTCLPPTDEDPEDSPSL